MFATWQHLKAKEVQTNEHNSVNYQYPDSIASHKDNIQNQRWYWIQVKPYWSWILKYLIHGKFKKLDLKNIQPGPDLDQILMHPPRISTVILLNFTDPNSKRKKKNKNAVSDDIHSSTEIKRAQSCTTKGTNITKNTTITGATTARDLYFWSKIDSDHMNIDKRRRQIQQQLTTKNNNHYRVHRSTHRSKANQITETNQQNRTNKVNLETKKRM